MAVMHETIRSAPTAAATNISIPGLWKVDPTDIERLTRLLRNLYRVREVWSDNARENPGLWFMQHYTHRSNLLFDVCDGQGFIAFLYTFPGWRSATYFASWGRDAMRRYDLWRAAAQIAMLTNDLLVIDGFIRPDNPLSQRAAQRAGMKYRGTVITEACYNGTAIPMRWYEIDRAGVGLTPTDLEV